MRTLKIYLLSSIQIYYAAVLTIVTVLHIVSLVLLYLLTRSLYLLTTSLQFPHPHPLNLPPSYILIQIMAIELATSYPWLYMQKCILLAFNATLYSTVYVSFEECTYSLLYIIVLFKTLTLS